MDDDLIVILQGQTSLHIPWGKLTEIYDLFRCEALSAWLSPAACREQKRRQVLEAHLEIGIGPCVRCQRGGEVEIPARTGRQPLIFGRGFGKIKNKEEKKDVKIRILQMVENQNYRIGDRLEFRSISDPQAAYLLERKFAERIMEKESQDINMREGFIAWPLQKIEADIALRAQFPRSSTAKAQIEDLIRKLEARGLSMFFSKSQLELRVFPLNGTLDAGISAIIWRQLYNILQERLEEIVFVADDEVRRKWPSEPATGIIILPVEKSAKPGKAADIAGLQKQLKDCRLAVSKQPGFLTIQPPFMPKSLLKQIQQCREALYLTMK